LASKNTICLLISLTAANPHLCPYGMTADYTRANNRLHKSRINNCREGSN
jgi:hypothetical protein